MTITINGKLTTNFENPLCVSELIEKLNLSATPVFIEVDRIALRPREHATTQVVDGSVVEIIRISAGG
jgi:thiamine biosynthesis protein ThiS